MNNLLKQFLNMFLVQVDVYIKGIEMRLFFNQPFPEDIRMLLNNIHMHRPFLPIESQHHVKGHLVPVYT